MGYSVVEKDINWMKGMSRRKTSHRAQRFKRDRVELKVSKIRNLT
jgi:hypothetical protein